MVERAGDGDEEEETKPGEEETNREGEEAIVDATKTVQSTSQ